MMPDFLLDPKNKEPAVKQKKPARAVQRQVTNPWSGTPSPVVGGTNPTQEEINMSLGVDPAPAQDAGPTPLLPPAKVFSPQLNPGAISAPTIDSRYGSFGKHDIKNIQSADQSYSKNTMWAPEEFNQYGETVMKSPAIAPQLEAIKALEDQQAAARGYMGDIGNNLSPTLNAVDNIIGSNLLRGYKAPMATQDQMSVLSKYANDLVNQKQDLARQVLSGYQAMKSGTQAEKQHQQMIDALSIGRNNPKGAPGKGSGSAQLNAEKWIIGQNQKLQESYQPQAASLDNLEKALNEGTVGAITSSLAQAARTISGEKGVLTDKDVARVLPATVGMDAARLQVYLSSNPKVLVSPKVTAELRQLVQFHKERIREEYKERSDALKEQITGADALGAIPNVGNFFNPNDRMLKKKEEVAPTKSLSQQILEKIINAK